MGTAASDAALQYPPGFSELRTWVQRQIDVVQTRVDDLQYHVFHYNDDVGELKKELHLLTNRYDNDFSTPRETVPKTPVTLKTKRTIPKMLSRVNRLSICSI